MVPVSRLPSSARATMLASILCDFFVAALPLGTATTATSTATSASVIPILLRMTSSPSSVVEPTLFRCGQATQGRAIGHGRALAEVEFWRKRRTLHGPYEPRTTEPGMAD